MKKILGILTILMLCFSLIYPLNTYAKITPIKDNEDYVIPNEYTFTPKFINGITKFETSDTYNNAEFYKQNGKDTKYKKVYRSKGYHNYWAIYRNVGIWKQHIVDMKITVDNVDDTDTSQKCSAHGDIKDEDVMTLMFSPTNVAIDMMAECREQGTMAFYKVEFFDGETGEELSDIKSTLTYTDIDNGERILLDNDNTKELIYYAPYGEEHLELMQASFNNRYAFFKGNTNWTCKSNGWPGEVNCINVSLVSECYNNDCTGCYKAGMLITLNDGTFTLGWGGMGLPFTSPSFLRIADPNPIKVVDKEMVKPGEEINYTIEQYVPSQPNNQHYKSWKLTDKLESVLETNFDNVIITSNGDEDVKNKFNITIENNVLTIAAKDDYLSSDDFYNRTFLIGIKARVVTNIKGVKTIPNTAVLNVQYNLGSYSEDIPSTDVTITIEGEESKEIVEVPNTGKFASIIMIISGVVLVASGIFIILRMTKKTLST